MSHIHFVIMNYVFFMPKQNKLMMIEIKHDVTMNFSTFKKKFIVLNMVPFSLIFLDIFSLKYYHFLKQEIFEQFFGCMSQIRTDMDTSLLKIETR